MAAPAVTMAQIMRAFGQPATLRLPPPHSLDAVAVDVMWLPVQVDTQPSAALARMAGKRVLVIRRDQAPAVPRDTRLEVAEPPDGSVARGWIVEGPVGPSDYEQFHGFDHHRVIVVEDQSYA